MNNFKSKNNVNMNHINLAHPHYKDAQLEISYINLCSDRVFKKNTGIKTVLLYVIIFL